MSVCDPVRATEVKDWASFAKWTQANFGVPGITQKDIAILKSKSKKFFAEYPGTDWQTLVQVANWCASKKRRVARVWAYVDMYRYAWADHAIDIHRQDDLDEAIEAALQMETDPAWRSRLRRSVGAYRKEVYEEWQATH